MRIGVDLGGTKIEVVALDPGGRPVLRRRVPTPGTYAGVMDAIAGLVEAAEADLGARGTVGIGMPGSLSPATGLVRNANSTFLNGMPLAQDLSARMGRDLRFSNDANCLALSEAADGAAAGTRVVFAVIIGTGCGGGVVVDGRLVEGLNGVGGEWGHNPLPWMTAEEHPGPVCWCGKPGCQEVFLSGPGLARDVDGAGARDASAFEARAAAGDAAAAAG
ncbi:MAG: ROK family protein, partial [Acetobacteraceae bacterium]|nr:ROK family protein [Acetobacteraceae bacterium]